MDKIRFGIVGFGHIGNKHFQHLKENDQVDIVSICDIDTQKWQHVNDPNINFFIRIEDMLSNENIDVLCVCTPNYLHAYHSIIGLNNDCHIVVEKPMALDVLDCENMIAIANQKGKKIFTVMQNRFAPCAQWIKKLLDKNELGDIFQIQVNCFWNRNEKYYSQSDWRGNKEKDGGVLFTQFSHFVDILYYLHGDINAYVGGAINNYNHPYIEIEDTGSFIMKSVKEAIINFNYSICAFDHNMESSITFIGENGTIKIGGQYLNSIDYFAVKNSNIKMPNLDHSIANNYGFYQGSMNNHDKVITNVLDNLVKNTPLMSTAEDGKSVVKIINNMYKIAKS